MNPPTLNRRDALARIALLMGGAFVGSQAYLSGSPLPGKTAGPGFSAADIALLDEIGDTIIPATDTPGAKTAGIGAFMVMMVEDCYDDAHHAAFQAGLAKIGPDFLKLSPAGRTTRLNELDAEQRKHNAARSGGEPAHYFRMMKQLTLLGYFTSEIGAAQALRFVEVPGQYDGNAPYKKGDRNWFSAPSRSV